MTALSKQDWERLERGKAAARAELEDKWVKENWCARDVAKWMLKWARPVVIWNSHSQDGTNYDRLAKVLIDVTGVKPGPTTKDGGSGVRSGKRTVKSVSALERAK